MAANQVDFKILPSDQFSVYSPQTRSDKVITYFTLLSKLRGDILSVGQEDDPNNIVSAFYINTGNVQTLHLVKADGSEVTASNSFAGTVTSVDMSVPTGFSISGNPITTSGTLAVGFASGYSLPTNAIQATWTTAYNRSLTSAAVTGTSTKTLTLNQQDGGTITASWSDIDTGLTSVGLTMPAAFSVANSPLTANGTLAVTAAGLSSQYIRGDGQLANFPTPGGGGSSVNYYLNGSVSQGTFGGDTYYELSKTPIAGAGTNFTRTSASGDGYVASFITDANDPDLINIPGGNWNLEFYFNSSSSGGSPAFYGELYKVSVSNVFTLIASGSANSEVISGGTSVDQYYTSIAVPQTALLATDRLAIRVYVIVDGRNITLHTENSNFSEVITTFSTGLNSLNGLSDQVQYFAVGTSGTDFAISSSLDTHTFNLPTASATNRGALSSADWTTFNGKASDAFKTIAVTGQSDIVADNATDTLNIVAGSGVTLTTNATTDTLTISASGSGGTVTSVGTSAPLTGGPITATGTIGITQSGVSTDGYLSSTDWNTFNNKQSTLLFSGPLVNTSGTVSIPVATTSVSGYLNNTDWTTFNGKQNAITLTTTGTTGAATLIGATLNIPNYADQFVGTVTSVNMSVPTGFAISGNPITTSGTLAVAFDTGYSLPTNASQTNWNTAYNDSITAFAYNTSTAVLTLTQQDAGTLTATVTLQPFTTSNLAEGTNLYYTDTRARLALSAGTGISYSTTTGVITNSAPDQTVVLTASTGISVTGTYPSFTIANTAPDQTVVLTGGTGITTSGTYPSFTVTNSDRGSSQNIFKNIAVAGQSTIVADVNDDTLTVVAGSGVTITTNDTTDTITISATGSGGSVTSVGTTAPITGGTITTTGTIGITQSGAAADGYLSSTDWNTFNNKQNALTNPVTGTGTTNYVTKWTSGSAIGDSIIYDNGTNLGIGTTTPYGGTGVRSITVNAASYPTLALKVGDVFKGGIFGYSDHIDLYSEGYLNFETSGTEKMRIDTSGNLGIGTTSPTQKLEVNGVIESYYLEFKPVVFYDFNSDTTGDWGKNNSTLSVPNDSVTRYTSTGVDSNINKSFNFDGGQNQIIRIRYKVVTGPAGGGEIFYGNSQHGYDGSYFKSFTLVSDGGWHTLVLDMSNLTSGGTDWISYNVTSIRFDLTNVSGVAIDIDWISIGGNGYGTQYFENDVAFMNGNVGIGTTSPASLLNLSATTFPVLTLTRQDNGTTAAGAINFSATSNVRWQISTNNSVGNGLEFNTADGSGNVMYITRTGNVLINTTTDSGFKLDVSNGSSNVYIRAITSGAANWATLLLQNGDGSWHVTNDDTGTFNIGTGNDPSDQQKLTIASTGAATFSSSVTATQVFLTGVGGILGRTGATTTAVYGYFLNTSGGLYFGAEGSAGGTVITGNPAYYAALSGVSGLSLSADNGNTVHLKIASTGAATFSSSVGINGVGPTYPLYVRTGTNQRARFVDNGGLFQFGVLNDAEGAYSDMSFGDSSLVIKAGGNVGIGTTNPGTNLHIDATSSPTIRFNASSAAGGAGSVQFYNQGTQKFNLTTVANSNDFGLYNNGGTNSFNLYIQHANGAATFSSSVIVNNATNDGVGALQVKVLAANQSAVRIASTTNNNLFNFISNDTPGHAILDLGKFTESGTYAAGFIRLRTDGDSWIQGGNVGIGTTAPTQLLHITATNAANNGITIQNTNASGNSQVRFLNTSGTERAAITYVNSTDAVYFYLASAGNILNLVGANVGIGTTSPFSKLQVGGNTFSGANGMYANDRVGISNHGTLTGLMLASTYDDVTYPEYGLVFVQGPNTSSYNVWSISPDGPAKGDGLSFIYGLNATNIHSTTPKVYFDGNGNVGIGTTAPVAKLEVNGTGPGLGAGINVPNIFVSGASGFQSIGFRRDADTNGGWFIGTSYSVVGDFAIYQNQGAGAPANRLSITTSGNVGIGKTDPVTQLQVTSATNAVDVLRIGNTAGNSGSVQGFTHLAINHFDAGTFPSTRITAYQDGVSGWPGGMYFSTREVNTDSAPLERLRITSAGNIGINTTNPTSRLEVVGDARITTGSLGVGVAPNATDGRIDASNDIVAFSTSDKRLKENITPIANALEKVRSLTGVEFDWKEETKSVHGYEGHDVGVIAQDVQAVLPEAVRTNDSGYLSVRYEKMIALLVEAMKEQQAQIDELKKLIK